jgi:transposase
LGSIDVASGEGLYQVFEHATTAEFLRHLDDLLQLFPNERLLLVIDQASWHSSDAVRDFQAHVHDRLAFIPLPTHSPHWNALERLWGYVRDHVTRNTFWGTLARECQAVVAFLDALDFATFQTLMSSSPCLR